MWYRVADVLAKVRTGRLNYAAGPIKTRRLQISLVTAKAQGKFLTIVGIISRKLG